MTITVDLTGKAALLTGAGSGLGRATAIALAEAGADLCIVDINAAGLEETAGMLGAARVMTRVADLSEGAEVCKAAVAATVERYGRLDALCNVAGVFKFVRAHEMSVADYNRIIAVNMSAPFFLSQAAIPHLLESEGAIVNCVSTAAMLGEAYAAAYCASKAGLLQMTKALAMEYVRQPIRINAVAPGGMATNITSGIPEDLEFDLIMRYSGLRGLVDTSAVADLIAMLASPAGRFYHGTCVTMDAGIAAG